jgi:hypothetical protein
LEGTQALPAATTEGKAGEASKQWACFIANTNESMTSSVANLLLFEWFVKEADNSGTG